MGAPRAAGAARAMPASCEAVERAAVLETSLSHDDATKQQAALDAAKAAG